MQISAATTTSPLPGTASTAQAPAPTPAPKDSPDIVSLQRVAALLSALQNNPEIRPETVARGRALVADPSYPPPEVINKLAGLVVNGD